MGFYFPENVISEECTPESYYNPTTTTATTTTTTTTTAVLLQSYYNPTTTTTTITTTTTDTTDFIFQKQKDFKILNLNLTILNMIGINLNLNSNVPMLKFLILGILFLFFENLPNPRKFRAKKVKTGGSR